MITEPTRKTISPWVYVSIVAAVLFCVCAVVLAAVWSLVSINSRIVDYDPAPTVVVVATSTYPHADGLALGDANASVKIDVFEDFQCPACLTFTQNIEPQVIETYVKTGQVYYVFHHYPFIDTNAVTKESHQAANASMCANEQGLFWEYRDVLFANWNGENQGAFNDRRLLAFAGTLALDQDAFATCFEENRYAEEIQADVDLGEQMGVNGTPSVFVNGEILTPGFIPQFDDIQQAVDAALGGQ